MSERKIFPKSDMKDLLAYLTERYIHVDRRLADELTGEVYEYSFCNVDGSKSLAFVTEKESHVECNEAFFMWHQAFRRENYPSIENTKEDKAKRFNESKPRLDLVPIPDSVAEVFEFGAEKYGEGDWKRGMSDETYLGSIARHLESIKNGEEIDGESGRSHWAHIATNALMRCHQNEQ